MSGPTPIALFLSAFDIATMIAMVGLLACRLAVFPGTADDTLMRRLRIATGWTLALLTLASLGILVSRTLEMNGGRWSTLATDAALALTATHYGHVWIWRVPALVICWAAWAWKQRHADRAGAPWVTALAVAVIVMTRSDTGHMADHGDLALAVWVDWLHVLAAGAWIGSVFGVSLVAFPHWLRTGERSLRDAAVTFQHLSTLSGVALVLVVACGIYSTTRLLGPVDNLLSTFFGINLDVKLLIVLVLILIGAHNRYVKLPRLLASAGIAQPLPAIARWLGVHQHDTAHDPLRVLRSCACAVCVESLLGLGVIGATGLLIHQMPPADMPRAQPMQMSRGAGHMTGAIAPRGAPRTGAIAMLRTPTAPYRVF